MEFLQAMNESLAQWLEENHDLLSWRNMTLSDLLYVFSLVSEVAGARGGILSTCE
jgi:hypothetical protein